MEIYSVQLLPCFNRDSFHKNYCIYRLFSRFANAPKSRMFIILMAMSPLTLEKSRGRLLHTDSVLGARAAPAHPLCDPQYGAAPPFL